MVQYPLTHPRSSCLGPCPGTVCTQPGQKMSLCQFTLKGSLAQVEKELKYDPMMIDNKPVGMNIPVDPLRGSTVSGCGAVPCSGGESRTNSPRERTGAAGRQRRVIIRMENCCLSFGVGSFLTPPLCRSNTMPARRDRTRTPAKQKVAANESVDTSEDTFGLGTSVTVFWTGEKAWYAARVPSAPATSSSAAPPTRGSVCSDAAQLVCLCENVVRCLPPAPLSLLPAGCA